MPTFQYDPGRSFRGWLRHLCRSRVVDLLEEKAPARSVAVEVANAASILDEAGDEDEDEGPERLRLLAMAAEAQRAVQAQVDPETWRAFWLVAVEGLSVVEAAELVGKSYAATFAAQKRVKQRLRAEGRRLEGEGGSITG